MRTSRVKQKPLPSVIDRLKPEVVFDWLPEEMAESARTDVARGRVSRPAVATNAIQALVADIEKGPVRVRIEWRSRGPWSSCECGDKRGPCRHAAALALMLVGGAALEEDDPESDDDADAAAAPPETAADVERRRRRERGETDLFVVRPHPGTRVYGAWEVSSPSSRAYGVVIRALDAPHNGCTCPDFDTNLLGTCKHIEAVLHHLRRSAPRRLNRALKGGLPTPYLFLSFDPEPEIRLADPGARPANRFFNRAGRPLFSAVTDFAQVERWAADNGIDVPAEVARFARRASDAAEMLARRRLLEAEVRAAGREQPGFKATLYPYQVEGVAFLVSRGRALLADEMGLGKTAQAIAAMVRLARTAAVQRTVIVCPASLKHQWKREIERFTSLDGARIAIVAGPAEDRRAQYASGADVIITSYELARTDELELTALSPDLLILDEAQRIKNWRTQTAAVVKRIPSRFAFVLTGTPLENRLDDLYSLMQVIDPHRFGPLWKFNEDFGQLDERGRITGYKNLDRLRARTAEVVLRRRKEEVLTDLPSRIVNRLEVPLTKEQRDIHDEAEEQVAKLCAILKKRPLLPIEEKRLMAGFQRMRMACDAAGLVDKETKGAPKLDELEGLLEEICIQGRRKVVIFSEWERMQEMAAAVCTKLSIGHVRLHGGVPSGTRGALIDRFRDNPACKVFLSTDAGGVGLNLQAASHVINLDLPWNPAVLAQRIARVHRLGQREAVNVVLLVSKASFEERMEGTLDGKRALFAAAVGDDDATTELSRSTMASRIATLLSGAFAATTGKVPPVEAPPSPPPSDPVAVLRARLGDALERIVRLPDGRLLGIVRGEAPTDEEALPATFLPSSAALALVPLGEASPLAHAEEVYRAETTPPDPLREARCARLSAAERKLKAARALIAADLPAESLPLLREAIALGCRALDDRGDPGEDAAALLGAVYGHLIPTGALTSADAHALVRAGELARAFAASSAVPPAALVEQVTTDARDLLARARERLGQPLSPTAALAG